MEQKWTEEPEVVEENELDTVTVDVDALVADSNVVGIEEMKTDNMMVEDSSFTNDVEEEDKPVNGNVVLGIVIGVCAILGITLGIILGRRAAKK